MTNRLSRRTLLKLAGVAGASRLAAAEATRLFDGETLNGWIQAENSAITISAANIADPAAFVEKLRSGENRFLAFLNSQLHDSVKADLAAWKPDAPNAKAALAAAFKDLNDLIAGPSLYDRARFKGVTLRPATSALMRTSQTPVERARLNKMLLEDALPGLVAKSVTAGWTVQDGAMASTGVGRGVIYTEKDYSHFRLMFTMRHASGNPDHQACVLIFCTRPQPGERPLDALAGIQFQPPNGGRWDYRPSMNSNGGAEFTLVKKPGFDPAQWSRVEILADATKGTARMAVAQPLESKAVEVLDFKDPAAGKAGPIAWQMHNAGLFDLYRDVTVEVDPREDALITTQ